MPRYLKLAYWVGGSVTVLVVGLILFFSLTSKEDEQQSGTLEVTPANVELSEEDIAAVKTISTTFLEEVGDFGYNYLEDETYENVSLIRNLGSNNVDDYYTTMADAYSDAADIIEVNSPAWVTSSKLGTWSDNSLIESGMAYRISDIYVNVEPEASSLVSDDGTSLLVEAYGTFTSEEYYYQFLATGEGGENAYQKMTRVFPSQKFTMQLMKTDNEWKVYSIDTKYDFILAVNGGENVLGGTPEYEVTEGVKLFPSTE